MASESTPEVDCRVMGAGDGGDHTNSPLIWPSSQIPAESIAKIIPRPILDMYDGRGRTAAIIKSRNCKMKVVLFRSMEVEWHAPEEVRYVGSLGGFRHAAGGPMAG